jgi:signal transduction histidine kinase
LKAIFLLPAAILIGVIVLSLAARGQLAEKRRLEDEFAAAQAKLSRAGAADLAHEWAELDEDGRLVATLANQMGKDQICGASRSSTIYESFRALATVVRYYRAITLAAKDCPTRISAIDPSEKPEVARWLVNHSLLWGTHTKDSASPRIEGPIHADDGREFFFYSIDVPQIGAVVLAVEARLLLQRVLRPRSLESRYVVLDPSGGLWFGCSQAATCLRMRSPDWQRNEAFAELAGLMRQTEEGVARTNQMLVESLGLVGGSALAAWNSFKVGDAQWSLAVVVSPHALNERERGIMWRLVLTGLALALSVGGIAVIGIILQRRQAALQARFRLIQQESDLKGQTETIVNNMPAGLIGVAPDGRVATLNRFIRERYSFVQLGCPIESAFPLSNREGARELGKLVHAAIDARRTGTMLQPDADLLSPAAGRFEIRVVPIEDPTQELSALVLVEDLSEVRKLERQLVRAEKLSTVGVLTAGLAHEIGTPLGIIRVRAETLLESLAGEEGRNLASILGQIDRISTTIRQLLDFSREQTVSLTPTDALTVARNVAELLSWRFRQKNLRYETVADEDVPPLAADAGQLQQVFVNLIMNSCDACDDGGQILVRIRKEGVLGRLVRIDVEDGGCGIEHEHLNAVFDPFFTTKKRGEGTGLGLSVVSSIVRNHGGQISIASTPGEKTTVTILWPAATEGRKEP